MKWLHMASFVFVIVGGINWGLIGFMNYNLVEVVFAGMPEIVNLVYVLVGASSIFLLFTHKDDCHTCKMAMKK